MCNIMVGWKWVLCGFWRADVVANFAVHFDVPVSYNRRTTRNNISTGFHRYNIGRVRISCGPGLFISWNPLCSLKISHINTSTPD